MAIKTPRRVALLLRLWPEYISIYEIVAQVNALPGDLVKLYHLRSWASGAGVRRNPEMLALQRTGDGIERLKEYQAHIESTMRDHEFGGLIFTEEWPKEIIVWLITEWEAGESAGKIAKKLHRSKNSIVGKIHRLAERKLVTLRPSPIIRNVEPTPRPAPRPPVLKTIPALASETAPVAHVMATIKPPFVVTTTREPPIMAAPPMPRPPPRRTSTTTPGTRTCQFPMNEGSVAKGLPWLFCDAPVVKEYPYCEEHCRVCYVMWKGERYAA